VPYSQDTGLTPNDSTTCEQSENTTSSESESCAADFPAKTSVTQGLAPASPASALGCGSNTHESFASFDLSSLSWKTSQRSLFVDSETFLGPFPPVGTMRNGRLYPAAPWVPHTCDDECSLWPTPTASMDGRGFGIPLHEAGGRYKKSTVSRVQELVTAHGWRIHPRFTEALMGFPIEWSAIEPSVTP
jgi:hypothetical protein